jgi:hypothetical protein
LRDIAFPLPSQSRPTNVATVRLNMTGCGGATNCCQTDAVVHDVWRTRELYLRRLVLLGADIG